MTTNTTALIADLREEVADLQYKADCHWNNGNKRAWAIVQAKLDDAVLRLETEVQAWNTENADR